MGITPSTHFFHPIEDTNTFITAQVFCAHRQCLFSTDLPTSPLYGFSGECNLHTLQEHDEEWEKCRWLMQTVANVYLFHRVAMLGKATIAHTQGNGLTNQICTTFHTCHFSFSHRWREQAWDEIKAACITPHCSRRKTVSICFTDINQYKDEYVFIYKQFVTHWGGETVEGTGYKMLAAWWLLEKNEMKFHQHFFFFVGCHRYWTLQHFLGCGFTLTVISRPDFNKGGKMILVREKDISYYSVF